MTHNLLVSFELRDWLRQGALIVAAIEEFGPATRIFGTTWVVCSETPAEEIASSVQQVLGPNDALLVLDLEAHVAVTLNVDDRSVQFLRRHWRSAPSGQSPVQPEHRAAACNESGVVGVTAPSCMIEITMREHDVAHVT